MPIHTYLQHVKQRFSAGIVTEYSCSADLQNLIQALVKGILVTNEPKRQQYDSFSSFPPFQRAAITAVQLIASLIINEERVGIIDYPIFMSKQGVSLFQRSAASCREQNSLDADHRRFSLIFILRT